MLHNVKHRSEAGMVCSLLCSYQCFGRTCCSIFYPEDRGSRSVWKI